MFKKLAFLTTIFFLFWLGVMPAHAGVSMNEVKAALGEKIWSSKSLRGTSCGEAVSQFDLLTSVSSSMGVAVGVRDKNYIVCELVSYRFYGGSTLHSSSDLKTVGQGRELDCADTRNSCFLVASDTKIFANVVSELKTHVGIPLQPTEPPKSKDEEKVIAGSGSGFYVGRDGLFITNYHVISGSLTVTVTNSRGIVERAQVFRVDEKNDLALLKVEGKPPGVLSVVRSSGVKRGMRVYALGFPRPGIQGQELKVTEGIISSLSGLRDDPGVFQISNSLQPGNSGGPLITESGQVIGVAVGGLNAEVMRQRFGSIPQNVNFAVKSNYLIELLESVGSLSLKFDQSIKSQPNSDAISNAEQAVGLVYVRKKSAQ